MSVLIDFICNFYSLIKNINVESIINLMYISIKSNFVSFYYFMFQYFFPLITLLQIYLDRNCNFSNILNLLNNSNIFKFTKLEQKQNNKQNIINKIYYI